MIVPTHDIAAFHVLLPPSGRLIGIDVGTKTLGLAVSDTTRMIASALETIRRVKFTTDVQVFAAICAKHQVVAGVIGYPISLDGSKGPRAQATEAFARQLVRVVPMPILMWDERLSTVAAERALLEADTSRRKRAEKIDMVAAAIILQGAIDRLSNVIKSR